MPRIVNTQTDGVALGVIDKNPTFHPELVGVTFEDDAGTPHTVYAHREGPFQSPEDIVKAWQNGTLHTDKESHDTPGGEQTSGTQTQSAPGTVFE